MRKSKIKKFFERIALIIMGIVVAFAILEVALTIFVLGGKVRQRHPIVGWWGIPGNSVRESKREFSVIHKVNSYGFRDREYDIPKPPRTHRTLILGDSFVEAIQVPLDSTFHNLVEDSLNSLNLDQKFEVIGMGMGGYGTAQEYLAFNHFGKKFNPDLVILCFFAFNDVENNSPELNWQHKRPFYSVDEKSQLVKLPFVLPPPDGFFKRFVKSLPLRSPHFLLDLISRGGMFSFLVKKDIITWDKNLPAPTANGVFVDYYLYEKEWSKNWVDAWNVTEALILGLRDAVVASDADFIVVTLPNPPQLQVDANGFFSEKAWGDLVSKYPAIEEMEFDWDKPNKIIKQFLLKENIKYIDLLKPFRDSLEKDKKELTYKHDIHWNSRGHELVAKTLTDYFLREIVNKCTLSDYTNGVDEKQ